MPSVFTAFGLSPGSELQLQNEDMDSNVQGGLKHGTSGLCVPFKMQKAAGASRGDCELGATW